MSNLTLPRLNLALFTAATMFAAALLSIHSASANDEILSTSRARQYGMEVQWFSQVEVDSSYGEVVEMFLNVDENRATTMYEIVHDGNREVYTEFDRDPRGNVMGKQGAKEWAELQQFIFKEKGVDVRIEEYVRPKSTLYALTTEGVVQSIDAETGRTLWTSAIGNPDYPSTGIAANDDYVAVVNGSSVYCLDADSGLEVWNRRCKSGPSGGVAVSEDFIFVTQVNGRVEGFPMNENGYPSRNFVSFGGALVKPLVTDLSVSWPTTRGFYNVGSATDPNTTAYFFKAESEILNSGAFNNGHLIFASKSGKAYAVEEASGDLVWEFAAGDPISKSPVSLGNSVYFISVYNNLFKVNGSNGLNDSKWPRSIGDIKSFVSASNDTIYFLSGDGSLLGINRETGGRKVSIPIGEADMVFTNHKTDRIYLGTKTGTLLCVRQSENYHPYFHADEVVGVAENKPLIDLPAAANTGQPAAGGDPFANAQPANQEDDPFGNPAEENVDPFGNPATEEEEEAEDPFGGGGNSDEEIEDPFGG